MRDDSNSYGKLNHLHFHNGSTCHGSPTKAECVKQAIAREWTGRVLERTDTYEGSKKKVKCYSLVCDYYDHYAKQGRFVAEIGLRAKNLR